MDATLACTDILVACDALEEAGDERAELVRRVVSGDRPFRHLWLWSLLNEIACRGSSGVAYREYWSPEFTASQLNDAWSGKCRDERIRVAELREMDAEELDALGFRSWAGNFRMVPLWVVHHIAPGERLTSISGEEVVVGRDQIDLDVRFGCIAYGFVDEE